MTKIFSPTLVQKNSDYWLRYWIEPKPVFQPLYVGHGVHGDYGFNQRLGYWEKSFKEVRIRPSQKQAFGWLARSIYDSWPDSHPMDYANYLKTPGVDLPPEKIKLCPFEEKGKIVFYAFLLEGKKETPDNPRKNRTRPVSKYAKECVELTAIVAQSGFYDEKLFDIISGYFESLSTPKESSKDQEEIAIVDKFLRSMRMEDYRKWNCHGLTTEQFYKLYF